MWLYSNQDGMTTSFSSSNQAFTNLRHCMESAYNIGSIAGVKVVAFCEIGEVGGR